MPINFAEKGTAEKILKKIIEYWQPNADKNFAKNNWEKITECNDILNNIAHILHQYFDYKAYQNLDDNLKISFRECIAEALYNKSSSYTAYKREYAQDQSITADSAKSFRDFAYNYSKLPGIQAWTVGKNETGQRFLVGIDFPKELFSNKEILIEVMVQSIKAYPSLKDLIKPDPLIEVEPQTLANKVIKLFGINNPNKNDTESNGILLKAKIS